MVRGEIHSRADKARQRIGAMTLAGRLLNGDFSEPVSAIVRTAFAQILQGIHYADHVEV